MATLLQLVNEILRRTGQVEISTLTGAATPAVQVRDFINETYIEMLQRLKVTRLQKEGTLTTVAGTAGYTVASDADLDSILDDSVLLSDTKQPLRQVDYQYPLTHGVDDTGRPEVFYRIGDKLMLYPIPDAAYVMNYQYLIKPSTLSVDADQTALPAEWEKILVLGAQARLEKFLGESGGDTFLLYRDGLSQLKARSPLQGQHRMKGFYRGA